MSWRCKKCGCEYFNIDCEATYHQAELDERGEIDDYKLVDKEMLQYVCFECGISNENLEKIAKWEDD